MTSRKESESTTNMLNQSLLLRWCYRNRRSLFIVLATTFGLTLIAMYWLSRSPDRYVSQLLTKIETAEETELVPLMQAMIRAGDRGIDATVRALSSDRIEVREASKRCIREELARWRHIEPERATELVHHLAEALDAQMVRLRPNERDFASVIASDILLWPLQADGKIKIAVLGHCEEILRQSMDQAGVIEYVAQDDAEFDAFLEQLRSKQDDLDSNKGSGEEVASNDATQVSETDNQIATGRYYEDAQVDLGPEEPSITYLLNKQDNSTTPAPLNLPDTEVLKPVPDSITPLIASNQPGRLEIDERTIREMRPIGEANTRDESVGNDSNRFQAEGSVGELRPQPVRPVVALTQLSHIEVMRYLHDQDYAVVKAAEVELTRRRFSQGQIAIGYQVTDPNPEVRLAAIRALNDIREFDPLPWLKWLCQDEIADVRAEAMVIIASSPRDKDREFVRELVDREQDPAVRGRFKFR